LATPLFSLKKKEFHVLNFSWISISLNFMVSIFKSSLLDTNYERVGNAWRCTKKECPNVLVVKKILHFLVWNYTKVPTGNREWRINGNKMRILNVPFPVTLIKLGLIHCPKFNFTRITRFLDEFFDKWGKPVYNLCSKFFNWRHFQNFGLDLHLLWSPFRLGKFPIKLEKLVLSGTHEFIIPSN